MVLPTPANFAKTSREILFSTPIPDSVTEQYVLKWDCKVAFLPPGHTKGCFPLAEEFTLSTLNLEVIEHLEGSTAPLKVKCNVKQSNVKQKKNRIDRKMYVKCGCKVKHPEHCAHSCAEYLANLMYHSMGVPVPATDLYCVEVKSHNSAIAHGTYYMLLSEWLDGEPPEYEGPGKLEKTENIKIKDEIKVVLSKHLAADIALANFDVCGAPPGRKKMMSNLLCRERQQNHDLPPRHRRLLAVQTSRRPEDFVRCDSV
jgi:hypothetical protein